MPMHQTTTFSKNYDFLINVKISPNAKILYGLIQALASEYGYCWATNEYFAERMGCCVRNICKLLVQLRNKGLIKTTYSKNWQGISRRIYINQEKSAESILQFHIKLEQKKKPIQEGNPIFYEEIQKNFKSCPKVQVRPAQSFIYNRQEDKITIQGASNTIGDIEVLGKSDANASTALPAHSKKEIKEKPKPKPKPIPKKNEVKMQPHIQSPKPPMQAPTNKTPPATPIPPKEEIKRPAKVIYQCLQAEVFDQAEKEWITANYDEHIVKEAIKYVNSIVIKTTRLQALKYGCRNKKGERKKAESHADQEQAHKDNNRKYTENLVKKLPESPHTGIDILAKGIEIYALGAASKSIFISWAEHGFKEQLHSALRKRGWRISE